MCTQQGPPMHEHGRASGSKPPGPDTKDGHETGDIPASTEDVDGLFEELRACTTDTVMHAKLDALQEVIANLRAFGANHQRRYRTLLDAVPDAVTLLDERDRIIDANRVACQRFGKTLEELKKLKVQDLNPELPANHIRSIFAQRALGESFTDKVNNLRGDGSRFPSEVHSNLFLDHGERRVIAVARDISEQQRTLEDLRSSEARYRMLLDAMDKGILIQDGDGFLLSANPTACRLLGLSERELKAMDKDKLSAWRFVDQDNNALKPRELPGFQAIASGQNIHSTVVGVYLPHLHTYRWLSISSVPQYDEAHEQILQVVSTFSDVSMLKREAEMFRTTQQLGDIGCWELDDLRGTLFWTEHMYRLHDVEPGSSMSEARMLNFLSSESRADASRALALTRTRGDHFELELEMHTAIGRRRWINLSGQPLERDGRIYGVVGTVQDIDGRKSLEHRLRKQATRDPLTDLPNRNVMLESIESRIASSDAEDCLMVFYIDLDRFKVLSDMLGHQAGDRLLLAASKRLRACTREAGELAHLGNDEFLLLVSDDRYCNRPEELADQIVDAFTHIFNLEGEKLALGVSIGIAAWPRDGSNAEQLIQHADEAMFEAKRRGRSTWYKYNSITRESKRNRLEIESQLRLAVDNRQLRLVYQPQLDLRDNSLVGVEALLRWKHPQLGAIPPDQFIPFAEVSGDIVRIGSWVIDEACRQLAHWREEHGDIGTMAINVSYRQLLSGTLVNSVREAIDRYAVPGSALELEFTERVLIDSFPETVAVFRELRELGVGLLIDDFGEGFSSLNYLRHLPIDGIKISHTFMQGIPEQAADSVICEAMVRIANTLDLKVIAEGVETEAQRHFMRQQNVKYAQGFLFSHPLEPQSLVAYADELRTWAPENR
ncbi:MAG: EAL domain-containing protein [Rhodanobacteraceae bacterium]